MAEVPEPNKNDPAWIAAVEAARRKALYDVNENLGRMRADIHQKEIVSAYINDGAHLLSLGLIDKFVAKIGRMHERVQIAQYRTGTQISLLAYASMVAQLHLDIPDSAQEALEEVKHTWIRPLNQRTASSLTIDAAALARKIGDRRTRYSVKAFKTYLATHYPNKAALAGGLIGYGDVIDIIQQSFIRLYDPTRHDPEKFFDETVDMALARQEKAFNNSDYEIIRLYTEQLRHHVKSELMGINTPPLPIHSRTDEAWQKKVSAVYEKVLRDTTPRLHGEKYSAAYSAYISEILSGAHDYLIRGDTRSFSSYVTKTAERAQQGDYAAQLALPALQSLAEDLGIEVAAPVRGTRVPLVETSEVPQERRLPVAEHAADSELTPPPPKKDTDAARDAQRDRESRGRGKIR